MLKTVNAGNQELSATPTFCTTLEIDILAKNKEIHASISDISNHLRREKQRKQDLRSSSREQVTRTVI